MRSVMQALAALGCALAAVMAVPLAAAAESPPTEVRMAYLAPASGNADVYVDGTRALSAVAYKTVSTYLKVEPGSHTLVLTAPGGSTATPLLQAPLTVGAGQRSTVAVGGKPGGLKAQAFPDDFGTVAAGRAAARFLHMAPEVPGVDVAVADGPTVFTNVSFLQTSPYKQLAPGSYNLQLRATGTSQVLFSAGEVPLRAGQIVTFTGIGGVGQPVELLQIPDAAAGAAAPSGGADTGAGGTSRTPGTLETIGLAVLGLAALALLALGRRERRARM
jgi:hypothetical protein